MNDIKEMVRADLAARLKATVKRRRPKPKGMLQRAAIAAAHVDVDEVDVDEVDVRDARLYRQTHSTFEDYCKERWGMTDRRARQLIDASQAVHEIGTTVPLSERSVRPLTKLVSPIGDKLPATESQARP